jgi:oxygen-dependent protoporphyrinogen oxidase
MRGKLLFLAGAAAGYVLGARAGRRRYEQIKAGAVKVWESPGVQKQVNAVEDFVAAKVGDLPEVAFGTARKLVNRANQRRRESRTTSPSPASEAALRASRDSHAAAAAGSGTSGS